MRMVEDRAGDRWLADLGHRLRAERRRLGVTATAAAEAAGVSRVTWHRMENGAPSVAAGAYAKALEALGIADSAPVDGPGFDEAPPGSIPVRIRIGDWPELQALSWSLDPDTVISAADALAIYERNGRHLDPDRLTQAEDALIRGLREGLTGGLPA